MFSAWAREIAQIKGVVSIVSSWIHLFLFSRFDLVFSFDYTARYPSLTLIISTCYCIYPTAQSYFTSQLLIHLSFNICYNKKKK